MTEYWTSLHYLKCTNPHSKVHIRTQSVWLQLLVTETRVIKADRAFCAVNNLMQRADASVLSEGELTLASYY